MEIAAFKEGLPHTFAPGTGLKVKFGQFCAGIGKTFGGVDATTAMDLPLLFRYPKDRTFCLKQFIKAVACYHLFT